MTNKTDNQTAIGAPEAPTLYAELKAAGVEVANHESDLYFPDTEETRAILDRHPLQKNNAQRFTNQAAPNKGERWIDVPFAFIPFWEKVQRRARYDAMSNAQRVTYTNSDR